jgi:hypothetical protein
MKQGSKIFFGISNFQNDLKFKQLFFERAAK